jgi:hypothetical protein
LNEGGSVFSLLIVVNVPIVPIVPIAVNVPIAPGVARRAIFHNHFTSSAAATRA